MGLENESKMNEEEEKRHTHSWFYHAGLPQINPRELLKREDCLSVVDTARRRFGIASSQSNVGVVLGFVCRCSEVFSC